MTPPKSETLSLQIVKRMQNTKETAYTKSHETLEFMKIQPKQSF